MQNLILKNRLRIHFLAQASLPAPADADLPNSQEYPEEFPPNTGRERAASSCLDCWCFLVFCEHLKYSSAASWASPWAALSSQLCSLPSWFPVSKFLFLHPSIVLQQPNNIKNQSMPTSTVMDGCHFIRPSLGY